MKKSIFIIKKIDKDGNLNVYTKKKKVLEIVKDFWKKLFITKKSKPDYEFY